MYRLADDGSLAVKIYTNPITVARAEKIRILSRLADPKLSHFTAWPTGLALDGQGRPRGLVLPVVERGKDVHQLYSPGSRRKHFPDVDWRFLVHVAGNTARAFATVHEFGLVIGDVNPGSILVLADGTVRLIDVDSFQVPIPGSRPLLCTVAVPLFLPPELNGSALDVVVRTNNHDAFGLAVTIFQLLMLGRHPYAGRYLGPEYMPIERAIVEHRFAFSAGASRRNMEAPPNTVGLDILPSQVSALFEVAFAPPSSGHHARPSAAEWVAALNSLAAGLIRCRRNTTHHYSSSSPLCPWCSLELNTGALLFGTPTSTSSGAYETEYRRLLTRAQAIATPVAQTVPTLPVSVPATSAAVEAHRPSGVVWLLISVGVVLIVGGVALFPLGLLLSAFGLLLVLGGVGDRTGRRKPWQEAYTNARKAHAEADTNLIEANAFPRHVSARRAIAKASAAWDAVPGMRTEQLRQLHANKRQVQLEQFLQSQLLESAQIKGIGKGRLASLSAYGIDTAWDVKAARIRQVPQFGEVLADRLLTWRRSVERHFAYDASRPLPPDVTARVDSEMNDRRRLIVEDLKRAVRQLEDARVTEAAEAAAAAGRLREASMALIQARTDLHAATGKAPD